MSNFPEHYPALFGGGAGFEIEDLRREYISLRENAPSRTLRGKRYFVGHDGIPSSRGYTNRREEHSAIALVNLQQDWEHPLGGSFRFLDYQVPLKARQSDGGIGKIDIVGVNSKGRLILVELKVESKHSGRGDSPFSALLQGLRYAAIVEANLKAIAAEARGFGVEIRETAPVVQLLATEAWWLQQGFNFSAAGNSQKYFADFIDDIEREIGITFEFLAFDHLNVVFGLDGEKPRLDPIPSLRAVPLR
ncbi:MAG: hypothetical protein OXF05_01820 [Hyphomicrobiales bacterium]|nr:hypothetical protein [Hyphomicrobiales bacterium]MCY4033121.1 hypothetical protein [Hyphomicrobiales bacterium]